MSDLTAEQLYLRCSSMLNRGLPDNTTARYIGLAIRRLMDEDPAKASNLRIKLIAVSRMHMPTPLLDKNGQ